MTLLNIGMALLVGVTTASFSGTSYASEGDVYEKDVFYRAGTYSGHPSRFGHSSIYHVVDLNVGGGNADCNTPLYAPENGSVSVYTNSTLGWGKSIDWTLAGSTEKIFMAHLSSIVKTGSVSGGDLIARVGNTGTSNTCHLHIESSTGALRLSGNIITPGIFTNTYNGLGYTSNGPLEGNSNAPTYISGQVIPTEITSGETLRFLTEWSDVENDLIIDVSVRYRRVGNSIWNASRILAYLGDGSSGKRFNLEIPNFSTAAGQYEFSFRASDNGTPQLISNWQPAGTFTVTAANVTPNVPSTPSAAQGTSTSGVSISWSALSNADSYNLYRCTSTSQNTCASIADSVTSTNYADTGGQYGTTYYYRIAACAASNCSGLSSSASGWRQPLRPSTPAASYDTYADRIRVSFSTVTGIANYRIYRCTSSSTSSCDTYNSASSSPYDVTSGSVGVQYYMRVRACSGSNCGEFSNYNIGRKVQTTSADDFYVDAPTLSASSIVVGEQFTVSTVQRYEGTATTDIDSRVGYYISTDSNPSANDIFLGDDRSDLSSNDTYDNESLSATIDASTPPGNYYVIVVADYLQEHAETNEQNNQQYVQLEVVGSTISQNYFVVGLGAYSGPGGFIEKLEESVPFGNLAWTRVPWGEYNLVNGETRPAMCDVDGNGKSDVVIGLGEGASGYFAIYRDDETWTWLRIPWTGYQALNGETYVACGDLDNDGKDEIVASLGTGGAGWAYVFDDADAGYAAVSGGWINIGWTGYGSANGETHPAVGNLDSDPAEEILLGTGEGGSRWVRMFDDSSTGFTRLPWRRAASTESIADANHSVWPAVCDGNLLFGVSSSGGMPGLGLIDAQTNTGVDLGWIRVPWDAYNLTVGSTYPSCGDIDGDGKQEILVGLGPYSPGGFVALLDDQAAGAGIIDWPRVHWSAYINAVGSTRPAVR